MQLKAWLVGMFLLGSAAPVVAGEVRVDIVRHDGPRDPPPVREDHYRERRGYVWTGGHHEWRHGHYVWREGHYARERRGREWNPGRWEHHDDHYDWHRGGWHPHR